MRLNTFSKEIVAFWGERGFGSQKKYTLQGISTWEMEIPDDHSDLKSPDFVGLQTQEIMTILPKVVLRRLEPPVYTLKVNGLFADIRDRNGKRGIPLTRNRSVLNQMCLQRPFADPPKVVKLTQEKRIQDVIIKANRQGTEAILFFALPHVCETIPIESALRVLKHL